MIATKYTVNCDTLKGGQYEINEKTLLRAAVSTGYPVIEINYRAGWCLVGEGKVRIFISKE